MSHPKGLTLFPGGSNGEFGWPPEHIPILCKGQGPRVWDADRREYLDMSMAWGSVLLGHAHPKIIEAAFTQARQGTNFAAISTRMLELAERVAAVSPCIERIRFVASGTEATFMCLRVARGATGRRKILKFEGAYHGQHPTGVASMVGVATPPASDASGTGAPWVEEDVLAAPYNDLGAVRRIVETHASELAAVIVEPLHRCLTPEPGFLEGLRELTRRHGVVLVFDEVVTGFRLALGGAQEFYGVIPDLVAYGKALGGGFPLGAYGGQAALMEVVNEHRLPGPNYVWSASTTGGNPVSAAAALATLDLLAEPDVYRRLHEMGKHLRARMTRVLAECGQIGQVLGDGPLAQVAFTPNPVRDHRAWLASDRQRGRELMLYLVREGIFLNPMGTKLYLSLAHEQKDLEQFLGSFSKFFQETPSRP